MPCKGVFSLSFIIRSQVLKITYSRKKFYVELRKVPVSMLINYSCTCVLLSFEALSVNENH